MRRENARVRLSRQRHQAAWNHTVVPKLCAGGAGGRHADRFQACDLDGDACKRRRAAGKFVRRSIRGTQQATEGRRIGLALDAQATKKPANRDGAGFDRQLATRLARLVKL